MLEKSPWVTIWIQPRATIRQIVGENPNRSLWLLAAIYGFSSLLNSFQSASLGATMGIFPIFLLAVVLAPFWGYAVFAIWSWVVMRTGKWLKGQGDFQSIRAAYAWSCVPLVVNGLLWILLMIFFGQALFLNFPEGHLLDNRQISLLFLILISKVVLAIWSLVIYLTGLAEVQQFSVLRAIGNVVISAILIGVALGVIWFLGLYILGMTLGQPHAAFSLFQEGKWIGSLL